MTPLVLAHRGACWEAPENTLEACELAIAEQTDYVEFDVCARNGELVICHDPGPPDDAPTLEEVLTALTGRVGLAVDVKEAVTTDAVLDALERHEVEAEHAIVVSFHPDALASVSRRRPDLRCVLQTADPDAAEMFWGSASRSRRARSAWRRHGPLAWRRRSSPSTTPHASSSSPPLG